MVTLRKRVRDAGGRIEYATQPYLNSSDSAAEMMFANLAIMAGEESKTKRERIRIGLEIAAANGAAVTSPVYGYEMAGSKRNRQWVVNEVKAAFVAEVFKRINDGESERAVATWLNSQVTGHGTWHSGDIGKMIKNEAYAGKFRTTVDGKEYVYHCPVVVRPAEWLAANRALSNSPERRWSKRATAMLAHVAYCASCGHSMYQAVVPRGDKRYRYYLCQKTSGGCGIRVNADKADEIAAKILGDTTAKVTVRQQVDYTLLDDRIAEIGREFSLEMGKGEDADFQRASKLRAEKKHLEAERALKPDTAWVKTSETYGDMWKLLDDSDRNPWLVRYGVKVWLAKDPAALAERYEANAQRLGTDSAREMVAYGNVYVDWSHQS